MLTICNNSKHPECCFDYKVYEDYKGCPFCRMQDDIIRLLDELNKVKDYNEELVNEFNRMSDEHAIMRMELNNLRE